ncbi:MAG: hypothetical protein M1165_00550 [Candidatus Pacearchaeota archaeon]|nr:hypothetical protein [Candidatus Pacearchaeota archaeon]
MLTMRIFLRTYVGSKKASATSGSRPFRLSKEDITLKCLKSVLISAEPFANRVFLEIIDDSGTREFLERMENLIKKYSIKFRINHFDALGNGGSMEQCYHFAEKSKEDLFYFLEDDYFHRQISFSSIFDAYDKKIIGTDKFAIHPTDYPDRYVHLEPSYIFLGKYNHWRSILSTTWTFVIPKVFFIKHKDVFYGLANFNKSSTGGEDKTVNNLWKIFPCISPVESLAAHLNTDTLPPLVDWEKELAQIKI